MSRSQKKRVPKQPVQPKKKRGPARKLPPMVSTHIFIPPHLLEWAKVQPEGFAGLVRRLLQQAYDLAKES